MSYLILKFIFVPCALGLFVSWTAYFIEALKQRTIKPKLDRKVRTLALASGLALLLAMIVGFFLIVVARVLQELN